MSDRGISCDNMQVDRWELALSSRLKRSIIITHLCAVNGGELCLAPKG